MISQDNQNTSSVAFVAKSNSHSNQVKKFNNQNHDTKDRPYCSHYKFQRHTIEKCYKLHEYPPGYKPKPRPNHINDAMINEQTNSDHTSSSSINDDSSNMFRGFSPSQSQQVMSALSNHLISVNYNETSITGKCYSLTINNGLKSYMWILDFSASQHVCHGITMFINKRKVSHHTVNLPNKVVLPVHMIGDIEIDYLFTLHNVLYVPDFELNLISVSALT